MVTATMEENTQDAFMALQDTGSMATGTLGGRTLKKQKHPSTQKQSSWQPASESDELDSLP